MQRIGLVGVVVGLIVGAGGPGQADDERDLEALRGNWTLVSLELNGEAIPAEQVKTGRLVVEGNRYSPALGDRRAMFSMRLGPANSPREIEFTAEDGPAKGQVFKGIYKLEGDRLTICRAVTPDASKPTEFATGAESGLSLAVWKRARPEK